MGERGIVPQGLKVDELDQDVGVLLWVAVGGDLSLHKIDLSLNDFLLSGLVLGLADELDQVPCFAA